ncbi:hypothetical protein IFM89_005979 [Coptis chinensis]|uniref:Uncharacterized protein n=1 Tax=Coptis chinensis TaxID=261450 RepID=A0A835LYR0_9MAGN|nr:hypothetical protein IFM89_005979 [Coptis chinensis]
MRGTPLAISHKMDPPDVDSQLHSIELEAYITFLRAQDGPTWTQFSSQYDGEVAIFSSKESVAQPKNLVCHNGQALAVGKGMIL